MFDTVTEYQEHDIMDFQVRIEDHVTGDDVYVTVMSRAETWVIAHLAEQAGYWWEVNGRNYRLETVDSVDCDTIPNVMDFLK